METKRKLTDAERSLRKEYIKTLVNAFYYLHAQDEIDPWCEAIPIALHETKGFRREGIFDREERRLIYRARILLRDVRGAPHLYTGNGELVAMGLALETAGDAA